MKTIEAVAVALFATVAFAEEPKVEDIDAKGMPKDYKVGASTRYAIWQDDDGWHFRYTTSSDSIVAFTGTIQPVGGRISSITRRGTPAKGVSEEKAKSTAPKYVFNLKINRGYEAGIDFTVDDKVTAIKFELKVNGKDVPAQVYIGEKGSHPKESPFHLAAKAGK